MLNLKLFKTTSEEIAYTKNHEYLKYVADSDKVKINKPKEDYSQKYFTYIPHEDGTFNLEYNQYVQTGTNAHFEYSIDNGETWLTEQQTIAANTKVLCRGTLIAPEDEGIGIFSSSVPFDVEGNIMSLVFGDNFQGVTTIETELLFKSLFDRSKVVHANNLVLPATTLSLGCYSSMFNSCRQLVSAPQLPATTLAQSCYMGMFTNCIALTSAPQLPATTLARQCYYSMFFGCTSLTEAPQLLAETLEIDCYNNMFNTCQSLNYIKMTATDISANSCLLSWVSAVAANGIFVKSASMNDLPSGEDGIPNGWTVENE